MPKKQLPRVLHPRYTSPLETALASPPSQGVQRGSTTGLQGMEGMSLGGELVLVSACLTVTPLITDGPETHTHVLNIGTGKAGILGANDTIP